MSDDRDLKRLFEAAREEDRPGTPPFESAWARARRRVEERSPGARPLPGWRLAAAAAALLVVAFLITVRHGREAAPVDVEREIALAREISEWQGPTTGLAALSGMEIRDEVPDLSLTSVPLPEDTGFSSAEGTEDQSRSGAKGAAPERDQR